MNNNMPDSKTDILETRSERQRLWTTFKRNQAALLGLVMVLIIVAIAVALGQDDYGRDLLSRIIFGARVSLLVGITSVLLGGSLGTIMGVVAGFKGGRIETVIMRVVDTLLAFPDLITGLMVLAVLGSGLDKMIIAIGIVISPRFARLAHGPTLALREKDFINAARSIGVGDLRMLSRHVMPNILGELLVMASLWTASAIRIEANLSFIGLGVSPPTPTWGQMIRDGTTHLTTAPWFSIFPGIAILVTVLAFNLLGDGLRDVLDPKLQA